MSDKQQFKNNKSRSTKLPNVNKSKIIKTEIIQPLIDPEYHNYGERVHAFHNYYEDLKLDNEGWPSRIYNGGKVSNVRHDDLFIKAHQQVTRMYEDEYSNVRNQLQIIQRIKDRYKVLRNI